MRTAQITLYLIGLLSLFITASVAFSWYAEAVYLKEAGAARKLGLEYDTPYVKVDGDVFEVLMVTKVYKNSMFDKAGLVESDIIVGSALGNNEPSIGNSRQFFYNLLRFEEEGKMVLLVRRRNLRQ